MWAVDHPSSGADEGEWLPARKLRLGNCMTGGRGLERSRTCSKVLQCSSPARLAVHRLLTILRKRRAGKRVDVGVGERESKQSRDGRSRSRRRETIDVGIVSDDDSTEATSEERSEIPASGCERQELTFNLAAGLGLLSLISASKTELDKTMELRREMEVFLMSIKEEHRSNCTTPKPSDCRFPYAVSTTLDGLSNFSPYSLKDHGPSFSQPESGISYGYDKTRCEMLERVVPMEGFNHLEEELAAELDRLQVDSDTGELSENQEISPTETATRSITMSSGEVIDPQDEGTPEYCGVPPLELERRLHEVLEARQEERIRELEAHLECMKKKLEEKEVEVTWWKDTAKLISKQVPEPSRLPM